MITTEKIEIVNNYCQNLQKKIVDKLIDIDPCLHKVVDNWQRKEGGGGKTISLGNGKVFEKGGVNFSYVEGSHLPPSASANRPELAGCSFKAIGVSLVLHTVNPFVPTSHCNVRFFIAEKPSMEPIWWFGGGFDLTPFYGFVEDCIHWHTIAKKACSPFGEDIYPKIKKWCDDYFYLKHRQEARGIGGIFFDDWNLWSFTDSFKFMQSVGDHFLPAYVPIVEKRQAMEFGKKEKEFQNFRRARYVEFNLVFDRGTLFGLQSSGRTESILVSMPPQANWQYNWTPKPSSPEAELTSYFLVARNWLDEA